MNLIEFLETDAERNRTKMSEIKRRPKGRSIDDPSVSKLVKKAVSIAYEYAGENMDTEEMIDAFQELFSASPQDANTTDELRPCPFCGSNAKTVHTLNVVPHEPWWIRCPSCGVTTPKHSSETDAIAAWKL